MLKGSNVFKSGKTCYQHKTDKQSSILLIRKTIYSDLEITAATTLQITAYIPSKVFIQDKLFMCSSYLGHQKPSTHI